MSLLLGALVALGAGCEAGMGGSGCTDGKDGDGDGLVDAADVVDCPGVDSDSTTPTDCIDNDEDGYSAGGGGNGFDCSNADCDDYAASVHPEATEIAGDGIDQNCDGSDAPASDPDADGDGSPASADCDDTDAAINPAAEEVCDGVDNNCDGEIDPDTSTDAQPYYFDHDVDGFGDASGGGARACVAPEGAVQNNADCNDNDAAINPLADELCDEVDNDCDAQTDEGLATTSYYADSDGDGFGDASASAVQACAAPADTVDNNGDCDDNWSAINPNAVEICDGSDNDCDGSVDEGVEPVMWYPDADGDGFGAAATPGVSSCIALPNTVDNNGDCDDTEDAISPNYLEVCDFVDNNCDGSIDEGVLPIAWYPDLDGDGQGQASAVAVQACTQPADLSPYNTDCDDSSATVYSGATEIVANGIDENCDAFELCNLDYDDDGYSSGTTHSTSFACDGPYEAGMASTPGDCDDNDAAIHPGATEICNEIDDDCASGADDGLTQTFYADADGDSYGDSATTQDSCLAELPDHVTNALDCDDTNIAINPDAVELCDDVDSDCDALADLNDTDIAGTGASTYTTTAGVAILDNSTATSTVVVSGGPAVIEQVEVIVSLQHTWLADLTLTLTSPTGTPVILMAGDGGSGDNLAATHFTEVATNVIDGAFASSAPFAGQWLPQQSLDAFQGEAGDGTWTLTLQDTATGDVGTLTEWSLILGGLGGNPDVDGDGAVATCGDCDDADPNNAPMYVEVCDDASDNDCDVAADCDDSECALDPACAGGPVETACDDNVDDDGDGQMDCDDSDCDLDPFCAGSPTETACDDGVDNDGDGPMDYMDPDCEAELTSVCGSMLLPLIPNPHSGTCLFFSSSPLPWSGADNACTILGGYLAVVDSAAENTLVRGASDINTQLWLGFSDFAPESNNVATAFQDVLGGNGTSDYSNFDGGEPNGGSSENCVAYFEFPFRSGYTWNDAVCSANYTYICEIEP